MRGHRRTRRIAIPEAVKVELTPMIDVVFLLLIFFMITTRFPEFEGKLQIDLPQEYAPAKEVSLKDPIEIEIQITKEGAIILNGVIRSEDELTSILVAQAELFPNQSVIIIGDPKTWHKDIVKVLNACHKAKIYNIRFKSV